MPMPCHAMLYYAYAMLCHASHAYAMLCHAMSCSAMLWLHDEVSAWLSQLDDSTSGDPHGNI